MNKDLFIKLKNMQHDQNKKSLILTSYGINESTFDILTKCDVTVNQFPLTEEIARILISDKYPHRSYAHLCLFLTFQNFDIIDIITDSQFTKIVQFYLLYHYDFTSCDVNQLDSYLLCAKMLANSSYGLLSK